VCTLHRGLVGAVLQNAKQSLRKCNASARATAHFAEVDHSLAINALKSQT